MTNEHMGTCIYEKGRFELRETDNAIIDLKGNFPPIMVASNTVDDGSEPNCADRRSVLHLLNELADNNPNEKRHWYLKKMLDKAWTQYHEIKEENEQLKQSLENKMNSDNYWEQKATEKIKELKEENEQLKRRNKGLQSELQIFKEDVTHSNLQINKLTDENEQLKQSMDNLFNYFNKWFEDERGIYIEEFSEMWNTIKNRRK